MKVRLHREDFKHVFVDRELADEPLVFEIYVVANWGGPGRVAGVPRAMRRVMVVMAAQRMMASAVAGWRS